MELKTILPTLKQQINEIIVHSQELEIDPSQMQSESLVREWWTAKKDYVKMFAKNGQDSLIYEFPEEISFPLDEKTRISKVNGFIDHIQDLLWEKDYPTTIIEDFIRFLRANINTFHENKVSNGWTTSKGDVVRVDTKLLKAFKFFLSGNTLIDVQQMASVLIQESKISGRFCVSVHPLDYLSSSENTYNWRSCHSLDGDYRSGNMAYMVDRCTLVCYLKGAEERILPRFPESVPWNSKKWRMLLFISPDEKVIYAGRQYPFESQNFLNFVQEHVIPLIVPRKDMWDKGFSDWIQYSPQQIVEPSSTDSLSTPEYYSKYHYLRDHYLYINGNLIPRRKLIHSANLLFYNDLLSSTKYFPSYCWAYEDTQYYEPTVMEVGDDPICPCCGINRIDSSEEMICSSCDEKYGVQENEVFTFCEGCGRRILRDDAFWDDNNEAYYCRMCYNEYDY